MLDPFNGSGTTGFVSKLYNRRYIGIDLEKTYLDLTLKRIKTIEPKITNQENLNCNILVNKQITI